MRKIVLTLSAAILLSTAGSVLANLHAQESQTTTTRTTTRDAQAPDSQTTIVQSTTTRVDAQTYLGKVDKKDKQYLLIDKGKKASYKLDDATKAEKFNGDNVKVVGTLDTSTNMIHVQSIEKFHN